MGIAQYNRGNALISRQIAADFPRPSNDKTGTENRLDRAEARIAELTAELAASANVVLALTARAEAAEASVADALGMIEHFRDELFKQRELVRPLQRARLKLSAIIRAGMSPSRYHELSEDYDREHGDTLND